MRACLAYLMAIVNRAIAQKEATVSPYCHVGFRAAPAYKFESTSRVFAQTGEAVPFEYPLILHGVDLNDIAARGLADFQRYKQGLGLPDHSDDVVASINASLKRRP